MAVKFGVFVPQGWKMDLVGIPDPGGAIRGHDTRSPGRRRAQGSTRSGSTTTSTPCPTPTEETTFEAWTITAGLVRDTQRVRVGQMVTCNGYRNPALLAKMASTVDAMSHGRLICGFGRGLVRARVARLWLRLP